jgi:hypothetical protein
MSYNLYFGIFVFFLQSFYSIDLLVCLRGIFDIISHFNISLYTLEDHDNNHYLLILFLIFIFLFYELFHRIFQEDLLFPMELI